MRSSDVQASKCHDLTFLAIDVMAELVALTIELAISDSCDKWFMSICISNMSEIEMWSLLVSAFIFFFTSAVARLTIAARSSGVAAGDARPARCARRAAARAAATVFASRMMPAQSDSMELSSRSIR